jgi:predicted Zn-dependent peptidase
LYQKTTLPNGLRILTSPMPHTRSASIILFYGVGQRYEPKEITGISHFIEHMLFKGTQRRPAAQEISEAIEGLGGSLNASTGREYTNYFAVVPSRHFALALDVLTDMLSGSRFDEEEIERERHVIIEEINSMYDSPPDLVNQLIEETMWGDGPLGRDVAGSRETVSAVTREQMLQFLRTYYVPPATVVSVAGQVEHDEVVQRVAEAFGAQTSPAHPLATPDPVVSDQTAPRISIYTKETEQTNVCIGLPALSYNDPDRYAQQMLDGVLGSGMSSRLFVEIREKRALAYSVGSYVQNYRDIGGFIVYAAVDNERVDSCLEGVLHQLDRVRQAPVGETELQKVKEYHKGHLLLAMESSRSVAAWGGRQELLLDRIDSIDEVLEQIDAVTPQQVQDLAGRLFTTDRLNLSLVGPFAADDPRFPRLLTLG